MGNYKSRFIDGLLLILLAVILFCATALCYPLLSFPELLKLHPYGSWGIPGILIIIGLVLIEIDRQKKKYGDD